MANRKYLDASGLNYLWQKIKYGFASVGASGFATNNGVLLADGVKGITGSAYTLGTGTLGSGATVLATEAGVSGAIAAAVEAGVSGKVGSADGFSAADRVVLTDGTGRDIHQTSYTLGASSMGSGATVLATEAGVSGAIAAATTNMVTAPSNFAAANQVLLAGGTNKTAKTDGYTIGGTELVGGDKVLATETGVSAAIDSAIGALPISGVTGNILSVTGNKLINTTLSLNYDSASTMLQIIGKDGSTVVSEIDASAFIKDGMLDYAGLHVKSGNTWTPALPEGISVPASASADGTYIVLNWNTEEKSATFINVTSLIDTYTADGQGLELSDHQFSLELDSTGNVTLSKSVNGLKANVAVTALTPTAAYGAEVNLGSVAGTTFKFTMPAQEAALNQEDCDAAFEAGETASGGGTIVPTWPE